MGLGHASEDIASFPLLYAWIQELQPGESPEEARRGLENKLRAILTNRLRRTGPVDRDDVTDCRNDVYLLLERKLREPMEFSVDSVRCEPAERPRLDGFEAQVMHLLRAEPYAIVVRHPDFEVSMTFRAELHGADDGGEAVLIRNIACTQERRVAIGLAYRALRHEQEALVEVTPEDEVKLEDKVASDYYARVKAVCHESFAIRMGFVTATARNIVFEHRRREGREGNLSHLDDLPSWKEPGRRDEGQDAALLALKRSIRRLPATQRARLRERYIEGRAWSEIAQTRGASEVKVRKEDSRLMEGLADAFVLGVAEAPKGAAARVVKWLKEMLPLILERE
jgi:hypothetical protein